MEIQPAEDGEVYTDVRALTDELPDNSPRFVLLSYPLTMVCLAERRWKRSERATRR